MKVLRAFISVLLLCAVLFTIFYGKYKVGESVTSQNPDGYKGIITLWQIDSFEGGVGSRKQFLLKAARAFEKQNSGVLVMVISHTPTSVEENIKNGIYPDIISYGAGVDVKGYSELKVSRTVNGGIVGEKTFATAWCRGGYAIIANPELTDNVSNELDSLIVSQGELNCPLVALLLEDVKVKNIEILKPMDAYIKFTQGKSKYFLGTQRDINRLSSRGFEVIVKPLTAYNDLYQYLSVTSKEENKRHYSEKFIDYLLSDKVQKDLSKIGMLSPFIDVVNENPHLNSMQENFSFSTISAFTSRLTIEEINYLSLKAVSGDKDALNKIKKMLV
ncbi:MAG: hypothetical protein IJV95_02915 [Clostridia bacterium]|nr:hypothetical protein [Clostridia bacterium]